ncbi:septum formation initiator family protein [Candidatus Kuenenbacteria bacterium]|nr:septum formation initiator family protein [Candidatus Kuenenbacteria bacterium]
MSRKGKTHKSFFSSFMLVFVIIFLVILFAGIAREYLKRIELDQEVNTLVTELEDLKFQKKDFLKSIENYESGFFLEQEAREKFNLKKGGEMVAVIPASGLDLQEGDDDLTENGNSFTDAGKMKVQNALAWWEYFFGEKA